MQQGGKQMHIIDKNLLQKKKKTIIIQEIHKLYPVNTKARDAILTSCHLN